MTESLDDLLRADHDRLDLLLSFAGEDPAAAWELRVGLLRHIAFEEESLFPALKGIPERTIESLKIDHEVIRGHLDRLAGFAQEGDAASQTDTAATLKIYLQGHNRDEEFGVYREIEARIPEPARAALIAKLKN
jgi:hemerythrin HHE cation binding domain-containing protein